MKTSRPEQLTDVVKAVAIPIDPEIKSRIDILTYEYRFGDNAAEPNRSGPMRNSTANWLTLDRCRRMLKKVDFAHATDIDIEIRSADHHPAGHGLPERLRRVALHQ